MNNMKTTVFFLIFIFPLSLFSFNNNPNIKTLEDVKPTDTLYIKGSMNVRFEEDGVFHNSYTAHMVPPEEFLFTGECIQSFNLTTGAIIFTDSIHKMLPYEHRANILNIYLNDKLLLENILSTWGGSSFVMFDLVFYHAGGPTYYLCYLSPEWNDILIDIDNKPQEQREHIYAVKNLLDTKAKIRKEGWDIFIQYLKEEGKLVGNTTSIAQVTTTDLISSISIYPNPTAGELRIENGELRIMNIQIFDIIGNKVLSLIPSPHWRGVSEGRGEVDISHLPAGIYFVQITTEKGVVTKKVVKR